MNIHEMTQIAIDHKWAFGPCGDDMWPEIEQTYNRTSLDKREITWAYWMHTGLYEKASYCVNEMMAYEALIQKAIHDGVGANTIETRCYDLAEKARDVRHAVEEIKSLYAQFGK